MLHAQDSDILDSGRFTTNANSIEFGPWHISYNISSILPSVCSTKVVCERDDDQFCQFCIYCKELSIPHFPDMVFPKNILTLQHGGGAQISFKPLDALKLVACTAEAIEVSCAEAWRETRPSAEKKKRPFDWTFSTDYKGTLSDNITVTDTDEGINFEILKQKDKILFYHDLTLFEDELHDHGISKLSVKIRVMPTYWYVLLRYFLRVDDVLVRSNETRMLHMLNSDYVIQEYSCKEAKASELKPEPIVSPTFPIRPGFFIKESGVLIKDPGRIGNVGDTKGSGLKINIPTSMMKEADDVVPLLPLKEKKLSKLLLNNKS